MPVPAPPSNSRRVLQLLGVVRREAGGNFDKAALLQISGSISEAFGVALLLPMIALLARGGGSITLDLLGIAVELSLPVLLGLFVLLIVIRSLMLERKEAFNARVTFGFAEVMSTRLFAAIADTRWSVVSKWRAADMTQAVTGDGDRMLHAINLLLTFVQSAAMAAIFTVLSLAISWQMTIVAVGTGLVLLLLTYPSRQKSVEEGSRLVEARRLQFRITDDFLNGLRTAKAFGLEKLHVESMREVLARIRQVNVGFMMMRARTTSIFQIATALALASFIYIALVIYGLGLERIVTLMFLYMRLAPRVMALHSTWQELLAQLRGVETIFEMLATAGRNAERRGEDCAAPLELHRAIEMVEVNFRYDGADRPALERITATIAARQITAIIGPTGSGKSTLVDLILGLLQCNDGTLLVDGRALDETNVRAWQRQVAYVPQETFLFNGSIADNLRMIRPDADDAELWEALRLADAEGFVRALASGLAHDVGDRGNSLSGGERQRLAIARALVRKPQLLILDEATSSLDALSQRRVAENIRCLCKRMTVIAIAHRASMIMHADYVIHLQDGKIAASGALASFLDQPHGIVREMIDADAQTRL
jgi:ATP-binding cassette, subfamily C, bacterial